MIFGIIASTLSAAPAPAGDTVIAVFAGQSNMTAFETTGSDVPVDLGGTDSGVRIWNTHTSALEVYEAGVNSDTFNFGATAPQKWGPEAAFAKAFRAANPTTPLVIVKQARNGTQLALRTGEDWSPDSTGDLYDGLVSVVAATKAALDSESVAYTTPAFFWMQGEEDANSITAGPAYGTNLSAFISAVRTDIGSAATKFILGRILSSNRTTTSTIKAFQTLVADTTADTTAIDMDDYPIAADIVHILIGGIRSLGQDFFAAFAGTYQDSLPMAYGTVVDDRRTGVVFTNARQTAEAPGTTATAFYVARGNKVPTTGKHYIEFGIDAQIANLNIGIGRSVSLTGFFGQTVSSVGYAANGAVVKTNATIQTYASYAAGDRIMMAFDGTTGQIWFGKNGTWNGDPAAGTGAATTIPAATPTDSPRIGATLRRSGDRVTIKPKAADWAYSPPTGFGAF
jgi:hypothetical protein